MREVVKEAGLRSDGELVQAVSDVFDFVAPQRTAGLLLPAVQAARSAGDGLPDMPIRAIDPWSATGDQDHRGWCDLQSMGGGRAAAADDDASIVAAFWDAG